jgi:hypothetical protein
MVLASPRRFRIFSFFVLLVILAFELYGINQLASTLPSTIDIDNSRIILQSLVAFNGVLLGFAAIVFATLISRETVFRRISYIILSMAATVATFLLSVLETFFALATMLDGLTPANFTRPLGLTIVGTTIFFYTIYIYMVRTYLMSNQ